MTATPETGRLLIVDDDQSLRLILAWRQSDAVHTR